MGHTASEQASFTKLISQSSNDKLNVSKLVQVVGVNGDQLVSVAPIVIDGVMIEDRTRDYKESEIIYDIPVYTGSCGGIAIKPSIAEGCLGTIVHLDNDMTNFIIDGALYEPAYTDNRHDYNDAWFLPGITGIDNSFNTDGCYEIISENVIFRICPNAFDVIVNGRSLIETLIATNSLPFNWGVI